MSPAGKNDDGGLSDDDGRISAANLKKDGFQDKNRQKMLDCE